MNVLNLNKRLSIKKNIFIDIIENYRTGLENMTLQKI